MANEEEVETVEFQSAKSVHNERQTEKALEKVEQITYEKPNVSITERARLNLQSKRDEIKRAIKKEVDTPRHVERFAEGAGSTALGVARSVMAEKREGIAGYALGSTNGRTRGGKQGSQRERWVRSQRINPRSVRQQIGGSYKDRVINPSGGRVGPQSENQYNDNLPQHFGAVVDWRATTSARLFDKFAVRSPIAKYGGGLPRFWDNPQGVPKKKNGMFVKGVFG